MGFSTSGSLLLIFFGVFIALGSMYTVTSNTSDHLAGAVGDQLSSHDDIQETDIDITEALWHETDGNLTLRIDNVGSTELSVAATDVLLDGEYRATDEFEIATVEGDETDIWSLGEQLRLENESERPERVKVVSEVGVAATAAVTPAGIENTSHVDTLDRTESGNESAIEFDITNTYEENVTLQTATIEDVNADGTDPEYVNNTEDTALPELNITLLSDTVATADGNFTIGETIPHGSVELEPGDEARYVIGEFRYDEGGESEVVDMPDSEVTITITYEDPYGVERSYTYTEVRF